mmetsp:Transcript_40378/g.121670  ORF Transcript_40378/g.121670 Transcript_40378/m.121670 type:complete len:222 (-) Transcript_40378:547-1212(-)
MLRRSSKTSCMRPSRVSADWLPVLTTLDKLLSAILSSESAFEPWVLSVTTLGVCSNIAATSFPFNPFDVKSVITSSHRYWSSLSTCIFSSPSDITIPFVNCISPFSLVHIRSLSLRNFRMRRLAVLARMCLCTAWPALNASFSSAPIAINCCAIMFPLYRPIHEASAKFSPSFSLSFATSSDFIFWSLSVPVDWPKSVVITPSALPDCNPSISFWRDASFF